MGNYFGQMSPTKIYAFKLRAVVAVFSLALICCMGMIYYLSNLVKEVRDTSLRVEVVQKQQLDTRPVLVTKGRVETGSRLDPGRFA